MCCCFLSSGSRQTSGELVTGGQTFALPICRGARGPPVDEEGRVGAVGRCGCCLLAYLRGGPQPADTPDQSPLLMELLSNLALGFEVAFSPVTLFYCFVGAFLGTFIGVLPGIGSLSAVSLFIRGIGGGRGRSGEEH